VAPTSLPEDNEPIETLFSDRPHEPLRVGVLDNSGTFVIHERRLTPDVSLGAALECDRWMRSASVV
jgi:hypothetical protein